MATTHRDFDRDGSLRSMSAVLMETSDAPVTPPKEPDVMGTDRWTAPLDAAANLYATAKDRAAELLASGISQSDLNFESARPFSDEYSEFRKDYPKMSFVLATDALSEMGLSVPN